MSEPPYLDAEDPNDWGVEETIAQVRLKKTHHCTYHTFKISDLGIGPHPFHACGSISYSRDRRQSPVAAEHHYAHEVPWAQAGTCSQDMQHY